MRANSKVFPRARGVAFLAVEIAYKLMALLLTVALYQYLRSTLPYALSAHT